MDLAAKVAADFKRDNPDILDGAKDWARIQQTQRDELKAKGNALSHIFTSLPLLISVLEGIGNPKADRVARDMRAIRKKVGVTLYG